MIFIMIVLFFIMIYQIYHDFIMIVLFFKKVFTVGNENVYNLIPEKNVIFYHFFFTVSVRGWYII